MISFDGLYQAAKAAVNPKRLSQWAESGGVAAAILTEEGHVYTGVCIDVACSMGFCAEHAAAAAMVTAGENHIVRVVAVRWDGSIYPPCGRCREFLSQLHPENDRAEVLLPDNQVRTLAELLPFDWKEGRES